MNDETLIAVFRDCDDPHHYKIQDMRTGQYFTVKATRRQIRQLLREARHRTRGAA